jgi:hypothetical protein
MHQRIFLRMSRDWYILRLLKFSHKGPMDYFFIIIIIILTSFHILSRAGSLKYVFSLKYA